MRGDIAQIMGRCLVVFLMVAAVLLSGAGPSPASAASARSTAPCAEAQALESLGLVDVAEAAYLRELQTPGNVACATQGLKRLEQSPGLCAYPDALVKDGERQAAHQAYLAVLAAHPSSHCASAGVKATGPSFLAGWGNVPKDLGYALTGICLFVLWMTVAIFASLHVLIRTPGCAICGRRT